MHLAICGHHRKNVNSIHLGLPLAIGTLLNIDFQVAIMLSTVNQVQSRALHESPVLQISPMAYRARRIPAGV